MILYKGRATSSTRDLDAAYLREKKTKAKVREKVLTLARILSNPMRHHGSYGSWRGYIDSMDKCRFKETIR